MACSAAAVELLQQVLPIPATRFPPVPSGPRPDRVRRTRAHVADVDAAAAAPFCIVGFGGGRRAGRSSSGSPSRRAHARRDCSLCRRRRARVHVQHVNWATASRRLPAVRVVASPRPTRRRRRDRSIIRWALKTLKRETSRRGKSLPRDRYAHARTRLACSRAPTFIDRRLDRTFCCSHLNPAPACCIGVRQRPRRHGTIPYPGPVRYNGLPPPCPPPLRPLLSLLC